MESSFEEFCRQYLKAAAQIYVRDEIDGRHRSVALSELPEQRQLTHLRRWYNARMAPRISAGKHVPAC